MRFQPSIDQLAHTDALSGYTVDHADIDAVMHETGVGDARVIAWSARELDDGDGILTKDELRAGALYSRSPAQRQNPELAGFRWSNNVLDQVMQRYGVADAGALIQLAARIEDGNRYLKREELEAAARKMSAKGYRWSPSVMADVMQRHGIASETAILAEARRQDHNHNRYLDRSELEAAAAVVANVLDPNDPRAVVDRVESMRGREGLEIETIGEIDEFPVHAMRFASVGEPRARVTITAGVHGNEPCGPGVAMLLAEQLLKYPELREGIEITIIPLVNPRGIEHATRRNPEKHDLNRKAVPDDDSAPLEVQIVDDYLAEHPCDLGLDLHSGGANRDGFWMLHLEGEDFFEAAMERLDGRLPLLDGDVDPYALKAPGFGSSANGNTFKGLFVDRAAKYSATLEAPGSVGHLDQVLGQNDMVLAILAEQRARAACA